MAQKLEIKREETVKGRSVEEKNTESISQTPPTELMSQAVKLSETHMNSSQCENQKETKRQ